MRKSLNACRWVYNKALETRKEAWEQRQENVSRYDTTNMIPGWKTEYPFLKDAYSQSLQEVCTRVDLAFKAFFRRVKRGEKPGYPRFRGEGRYDSFAYPQSGFELLDKRYLRLSKIGNIKIKIHRSINGRVKVLTIRRNALGNWYACFSCEIEPEPLSPSSRVVGIDMGLVYFATLSTGKHIENPRFFRQDEEELTKAQRRLSKYEKNMPEYRKCKRVIQHIHQRIANRRRNFAHQLSRRLVNGFQIIVFENLDIQNIQRDNWHSMNKSISDAAWHQLRQYTTYKAEWAGRACIAVEPRNTSQMCSRCGEIVSKGLSIRVHDCPHCGLVLDRDHNAALNILALGLQCMGSIPRSPAL